MATHKLITTQLKHFLQTSFASFISLKSWNTSVLFCQISNYPCIQALFLRTTWADSEMLQRSNQVKDCQEQDGPCWVYGENCVGCIRIEALGYSDDDNDDNDDSDDDNDDDNNDDDDSLDDQIEG